MQEEAQKEKLTAKIFFTKKIPSAFKIATKKTWEYIKIARVELIVLAAILAFDLITKYIAEVTLDYGSMGQVTAIPRLLHWQFRINPYAAAGFLRWIAERTSREFVRIGLLIFTILALGAFCHFMYRFRGKHILSRLSFSIIIAGTLGNAFDRAFVQYTMPNGTVVRGVRDFILIDFFPFIFNIADVALVVGVIIFAIYFIFMFKPAPPPLVGPVVPVGWNLKLGMMEDITAESNEKEVPQIEDTELKI